MGLTSCCCCVPLRTGALAIGILYLVGGVLVFISSAFSLSTFHSVPRRAHTDDPNLNMVYSSAVILVKVSTIATLCFSIFHILFNSMLIHGIRKQIRCLVLSWVSWYGFFNGIATLAWFGLTIFLLTRVVTLPSEARAYFVGYLLASILGGSAALAITWYLYACVVAYYQSETRSDNYSMYPASVVVEGAAQKY